jgi:hypothetical protein
MRTGRRGDLRTASAGRQHGCGFEGDVCRTRAERTQRPRQQFWPLAASAYRGPNAAAPNTGGTTAQASHAACNILAQRDIPDGFAAATDGRVPPAEHRYRRARGRSKTCAAQTRVTIQRRTATGPGTRAPIAVTPTREGSSAFGKPVHGKPPGRRWPTITGEIGVIFWKQLEIIQQSWETSVVFFPRPR